MQLEKVNPHNPLLATINHDHQATQFTCAIPKNCKTFFCSVSVIFIGPGLCRCIIKYICPCPAWHGQSNLNSNWSDNSHQSNLLDLSRSNLPISLLLESTATAWSRKIASLNLAFIKVSFAQFCEHSSNGFQWKI